MCRDDYNERRSCNQIKKKEQMQDIKLHKIFGWNSTYCRKNAWWMWISKHSRIYKTIHDILVWLRNGEYVF